VPIRLLGGLHYLALADGVDPWSATHQTIAEHRDWLARFVAEQDVQTNEVGRCFALLPAFLLLARASRRRVDLLELGPSGGLNLLVDRYGYRYRRGDWGAADAAVVLTGGEIGPVPADLLGIDLPIGRRRGIDLNPVDLSTDEGVRLLTSFVWADQWHRLERLRRAIEVARAEPPELVRGDYVELLPQLLAERDPDALTVVFQIASTPYVAEDGRRRLYAALARAGRDGSLAFLNATRPEPGWRGDGYGLELQQWPGRRRYVAHLDFHGEWVSWRP
jgi:hypothetical protein